jgi:hypothetical protein
MVLKFVLISKLWDIINEQPSIKHINQLLNHKALTLYQSMKQKLDKFYLWKLIY